MTDQHLSDSPDITTQRNPTAEQMAVVFRSEDGREVTFGLLWETMQYVKSLGQVSGGAYYCFRRLCECMGVQIVMEQPRQKDPPPKRMEPDPDTGAPRKRRFGRG